MRRTPAALIVAIAVALSGLAGPARADDTPPPPTGLPVLAPGAPALPTPGAPAPPTLDGTVVVHGLDYPENGTHGLYVLDCGDPRLPGSEPAVLSIDYTSDSPPIGLRMHGFDLTGSAGVGPHAYTPTPSSSEWALRVNPTGEATTGHAVAVYFPEGYTGDLYMGSAAVSHSGPGWGTLDMWSRSLQWWQWLADSQTWTSAGSDTLPGFVAGHGGDGTVEEGSGAMLGFVLGCDGEKFWFDGLRVGAPGDVTTYDYEGGLTAAVMDSSDARVTAGRKTVVRGSLDTEVSGYYASLEMVLEAREVGQSEFAEVGRATSTYDSDTGIQSPVRLAVRPDRHTKYRWVIPPGPATEGSTSPVTTVEVRSAATLQLARSTVAKGDQLAATGEVTPAGGRVKVALQRLVGKKWKTIDAGRTKADGGYRLAARATEKGTWKLRVLVAKTDTNLEGTSKVRPVTVR